MFAKLKDTFDSIKGPAAAIGLGTLAAVTPLTCQALADEAPSTSTTVAASTVSANSPQITYVNECKYATCVGDKAADWSEQNPFGVGVADAKGTKSPITDDQIVNILSSDFAKQGINQIGFFFEQNDAPATGVTLHVRGGTEGLFKLDKVRNAVPYVANMAKNKNTPLASLSSFD